MTAHNSWSQSLLDEALRLKSLGLNAAQIADRIGKSHEATRAKLQRVARVDPWAAADAIPVDVSAFGSHERLGLTQSVGTFSQVPTDRDTEPSPPPAARDYVDRQPESYSLRPLDVGSRSVSRILVIPDVHAPFHDRRAWDVMMAFARIWRPDTIVQVGDLIDGYTVSRHPKDPRVASVLEQETTATKAIREELDSLGAERKCLTVGNHDSNLERTLMEKCPALLGSLNIDSLLGLSEHRWMVVPYKQHLTIGHLHFTHEAGFCGANAVRQTGELYHHNILFGHTHRLGADYFGDVLGRRYVSASLGWLGRAECAEYEHDMRKKRHWQHGFGAVEMERDGTFQLQVMPIVDYRVIHNGVRVAA